MTHEIRKAKQKRMGDAGWLFDTAMLPIIAIKRINANQRRKLCTIGANGIPAPNENPRRYGNETKAIPTRQEIPALPRNLR
jgi:hypothetical protein